MQESPLEYAAIITVSGDGLIHEVINGLTFSSWKPYQGVVYACRPYTRRIRQWPVPEFVGNQGDFHVLPTVGAHAHYLGWL